MGRIRSIKPEFCQSEAIAALPRDVRLHFIQLWTYADDYGRGKDEPRIIKGAVWPLDDDVTPTMVEAWQQMLADQGRIVRYEVEGRRFFEVVNWMEHQKPNRRTESKVPTADQGTEAVAVQAQCNGSASAVRPQREFSAVVVDGDGEVEGDVAPVSQSAELVLVAEPPASLAKTTYTDEFETWWKAYPRKIEKNPASKAYAVARRTRSAEHLLTAVTEHAKAWEADAIDQAYIVYPERWLKRKRYDEAPERRQAAPRPIGRAERNQAALDRGLAMAKGQQR